jgi:hypothetical protein
VQALPALLAGRFDSELANGEDVEITEPLRLVVSVSLADLLAGIGVDEIVAELDLSAAPPGESMLPPAEMSSVVGPDTALPDHVAAAIQREPDLAGLVRRSPRAANWRCCWLCFRKSIGQPLSSQASGPSPQSTVRCSPPNH